jgi:hypothetical protein
MKVADDAAPSVVQRLRALGAEVQTDSIAPRTGEQTYSRYTVYARWPTPQTTHDRLLLELSALDKLIAEARRDYVAAEGEYNAAKRILNRNAYRKKQAHAKLEPLLEQHDHLTAIINRKETS